MSNILRTYSSKMETNDKFILTAKMLLDTGAVVNICPTKYVKQLLNNWIKESKLRVLTANGETERAGGEFEVQIAGCVNDYRAKFYCLNNGEDWLLSFSVLEDLGFKCYLGTRSDGKGYLITPQGSIITIHREPDGCYSVFIEFTITEKGDLKFKFIDEKKEIAQDDIFMQGPATAYSLSQENFEIHPMDSLDEDNIREWKHMDWKDAILKNFKDKVLFSCEVNSVHEDETFVECFSDSDEDNEEAYVMGAKDTKREAKIQVTTNLTYPSDEIVGSSDTGSAHTASTMRVYTENYEDWTEGEINSLDPFKEKCVENWLTERKYSENHKGSENDVIIYYCDDCQGRIVDSTCLCGKTHDTNQAVEEKGDEITICYLQNDVTNNKSDKCYLTRDIPIELKMSDDHAESPRGLLGLLADEKEGKLQKNNVNIQSPKNKVKEYETLKDRREKVKGSFNRNKDGGIIHRFPLQNDPMELHEAFGHPSDEILAKMEECLHGVPVMKRVSEDCELCRNLKRRKIPKKKVEGADHTAYMIGESISIDFTRWFEDGSIEGEHVGLLAQINNTGYPMGITLKDHTEVIDALDTIYKYMRTKLGVSLIHIHADCDSLWYSVEGAQECLGKVARWCYHHVVDLTTNSPGISQQNGVIESTMSKVMALTSIQLRCAYLDIVFWARSFKHAVCLIGRRPWLHSKLKCLVESVTKIPFVVTFKEMVDMSVFAAPFGSMTIQGEGSMAQPVKASSMKSMGHFGLFMGIPQNKGFLTFSLVTLKVRNKYNVKFIRDLTKRPMLLKDAGLFSPVNQDSKDRVLIDAALSACFNDYSGEREMGIICMNRFTGRPMKVVPFLDLHGDMYSMLRLDDDEQNEKSEDMHIEGGMTGDDELESDEEASSVEGRSGKEAETPAMESDDEEELVDKRSAGRRSRKFSAPRFGGPGGRSQAKRRKRKSEGEKNGYDSDGNKTRNYHPAEPKVKEFLPGISPFSNKDLKRVKPHRRLPAPGGVRKRDTLEAREIAFAKNIFENKPDEKIRFTPLNPKKPGTGTAQRYDLYKHAKTVKEYREAGGKWPDFVYAIQHGQVFVECMNPTNMVLRTHALFIPALRQSNIATQLRVCALSREDDNVAAVLSSRVQMIMKQSQGTDAISWALDKKYNLQDDENDMDNSEREEFMKRVGQVSAEDKKPESETERAQSELTGEILRGLGVNQLHLAKDSLPYSEYLERSTAKVCTVLQDCETYLREKEGRPLRKDLDEVLKAAKAHRRNPENILIYQSKKIRAYVIQVAKMQPNPKSVVEAINRWDGDEWIPPIIAEWERLHKDFPTMELVERYPEGADVVPLLWVLTQKYSATGEASRKKCRIVAAQTRDKFPRNKEDLYSPTVNSEFVRLILAISLEYDCSISTFDVAGGFLTAEYDDEEFGPLYVKIPSNLEEVLTDRPDLIPRLPNGKLAKYAKVKRSLYGARASPLIFFRKYRDFIIKSESEGGPGFTQSKIDPCCFYKRGNCGDGSTKGLTQEPSIENMKHSFGLVSAHVDDALLSFSNDQEGRRMRQDFEEKLFKEFNASPEESSGDQIEYLSMLVQIDREKGCMTFQVPKLLKKLKQLLEEIKNGKGAHPKGGKLKYPLDPYTKDIFEETSEENPIVAYSDYDSRSVLGLAAYIVLHTRPDCAYSAAVCARFAGCRNTKNVVAAINHLAWYLVDTADDHVLTFWKTENGAGLNAFSDASFANCPITRKSHYGYFMRYGHNIFGWRSKLQSIPALSSRDSELIASVECIKHLLGVRFFLCETGFLHGGPTPVKIDNKASLEGIRNDKISKSSMYMGYRLAWVKHQLEDGLIDLSHVVSEENLADILTKSLKCELLRELRAKVLRNESAFE